MSIVKTAPNTAPKSALKARWLAAACAGLPLAPLLLPGLGAGAARAQVPLPAAQLRGTGSALLGETMVRALNCIGQPGVPPTGLNRLGTTRNQLLTVTPGSYLPTTPSFPNPPLDCATTEIQPGFEGRYVAQTGDLTDFGRRMWRRFSNQFTTGTANPFAPPDWPNVQFALSETPVTTADLIGGTSDAGYNNLARPSAGPAIAFPLFVMPIAIAYNPTYGYRNILGVRQPLNLNVRYPLGDLVGGAFGGLRLNRDAYCRIANGQIINFNDPALQILNGGQPLLDPNDSTARWASEGVPIRLVGSADSGAGSTNIVTRHLAAVCGFLPDGNPPPAGSSPLVLSTAQIERNIPVSLAIFGTVGGSTLAVLPGGTLPAGMTLNSSGRTIAGTPTTTGVSTFTLRETSVGTPPRDQLLSITVVNGPPALGAVTLLPVGATLNSFVSIPILGTTAGSTLAVQAGALPAGLTLNSAARTISGTPTGIAVAEFTLRETLAGATNTPRDTALAIAVGQPPSNFGNKFRQSAAGWPYYANPGQPDLSGCRPGTRYFPSNTSTTDFANDGTQQSISGAYYIRVAEDCALARTPDTIDTSQGAEAAGLFLLANGAAGVEAAIFSESPATLRPSAIDPSVVLNGKLGFLPADWVRPAPGRRLFVAALQIGSGPSYAAPNAVNAGKAFGTLLPPQTVALNGAFGTGDARPSALGGTLLRARPQDWAQALYPTPLTGLAAPAAGYPITGVSYLLTYQCWSTPALRLAMANTLGILIAKVNKKSDGTALNPNTFLGTGTASFGILSRYGVGVVPAAWRNAILETFLKKSVQLSNGVRLGDLNLWIEDRFPTKTTDFDGITSNGEVLPNPGCTPGSGA